MQNASVTSVKTVQLPENLDLLAAASLVQTFLPMRGTDIVVDGSHVQRLGGQCLQILLSTISTWSADGASLEFVNLSPEFKAGLELFGVQPEKFADQELFR